MSQSGDDRNLVAARHFEIVCALAGGLAEGDGGRHVRFFHPNGTHSSSELLHGDEWLDYNMIQSGRRLEQTTALKVTQNYRKLSVEPVVDGEPRYEDHPRAFKSNSG